MAEGMKLIPQPHGGAISSNGRPPGFLNPNAGRPTELTPKLHQQIVKDIRDGMYAQVAAARASISEQTFYGWLKRGEAGEDPFREFLDAVLSAAGEAEKNMVDTVQDAAAGTAKGDWKAGAWWLERRFPKRWGRQERLEITTSPDLSDDAW